MQSNRKASWNRSAAAIASERTHSIADRDATSTEAMVIRLGVIARTAAHGAQQRRRDRIDHQHRPPGVAGLHGELGHAASTAASQSSKRSA